MNKTECLLSVEDLRDACLSVDVDPKQAAATSFKDTMRRSFSNVDASHITAIFRGRRLAINTTIIIMLWAIIGLAYPLYNAFLPLLLAKLVTSGIGGQSLDTAYSDYAIQAACGVPGSLLGAALVEWRVRGKLSFVAGRRGALAWCTILTSVFLFAFTTAKTNNTILVWNCLTAFIQNAMYAVLYGYTPEVFSAEDRGTGDALCSGANRLMGMIAPIIKLYGANTVFGPVYTAAGLFMGAGILAFFLRESEGYGQRKRSGADWISLRFLCSFGNRWTCRHVKKRTFDESASVDHKTQASLRRARSRDKLPLPQSFPFTELLFSDSESDSRGTDSRRYRAPPYRPRTELLFQLRNPSSSFFKLSLACFPQIRSPKKIVSHSFSSNLLLGLNAPDCIIIQTTQCCCEISQLFHL